MIGRIRTNTIDGIIRKSLQHLAAIAFMQHDAATEKLSQFHAAISEFSIRISLVSWARSKPLGALAVTRSIESALSTV